MPKWTLKKQDATGNQGSWLASIIDERGRVIQQTWCPTEAACDEWFSDRLTTARLKEEGATEAFAATAEEVASEVVGEPATEPTEDAPTAEVETETETPNPRRRRGR